MALDYTRNPPVYSYNRYVKETYLDGLVPREVEVGEGDERETVWEIEIPKAREATQWLMHVLQMPYDARTHIEERSFSAEEKRLLFPFAFLMCCLDGNLFGDDFIVQYTSDAWAAIKSNHTGISDEEIFSRLREMLVKAQD